MLQSRSFPALGVRLRNGSFSAPLIFRPNGVMRSFRIAPGLRESILVLTTSWFPPPAFPAAIALHLSEYSGDQSSRWLADPVPGTDALGNNSTAAELCLGDDDSVHVVYCGCPPGGSPRARHWYHVVLGIDGRSELVHDFGLFPEAPSFARLLSDPRGRLHVLLLFPPGKSGNPRYQLLRLKGRAARPGPAERFIVDPQLKVHGVRFAGKDTHYVGPAELLLP